MIERERPTVEELASDVERVADLQPVDAGRLAIRLAGLVEALRLRAAAAPASVEASDRLLGADEVARAIGMSRRWVYSRGASLPFARRMGRSLRFSEAGMRRWMASQGSRAKTH